MRLTYSAELSGTCRHANEFNLNIPLLEHSQIQPYLKPVITHILEDMLAEVHINPAVFGDALESCVTRFLNHPDEIRLFHHIQRYVMLVISLICQVRNSMGL